LSKESGGGEGQLSWRKNAGRGKLIFAGDNFLGAKRMQPSPGSTSKKRAEKRGFKGVQWTEEWDHTEAEKGDQRPTNLVPAVEGEENFWTPKSRGTRSPGRTKQGLRTDLAHRGNSSSALREERGTIWANTRGGGADAGQKKSTLSSWGS